MITRRRLIRLAEAQNWRCAYCAVVMQADDKQAHDAITRDHVEPKCMGGKASLDNIVVACKRCNGDRGAMMAHTFLDLIRRGWRPKTKRELKALAKKRKTPITWPPRPGVKTPEFQPRSRKRFRVTEDRAISETVA